MTIPDLKTLFLRQVQPVTPNDWEVEEIVEHVSLLPSAEQQALMSYVSVVWPVSHSLCFSFLEYGVDHIRRFGSGDLAEWVRQLLGRYEKEGLRGARTFMTATAAQHEENGMVGARLEDIRGRLLPFVRGVSGMPLDIASGSLAWTDTATLYLPEEVRLFADRASNERFYFFLACCQWGYIVLDTFAGLSDEEAAAKDRQYDRQHEGVADLESFLSGFPEPELALDLYHFQEFSRVYRMLTRELPGLMRSMQPLLVSLVAGWERGDGADGGRFQQLLQGVFHDTSEGGLVGQDSQSLAGRCRRTSALYSQLQAAEAGRWSRWQDLAGKLDFRGVRDRLARRRSEERQAIVSQLAAVIEKSLLMDDEEAAMEAAAPPAGEDGSQLMVTLSSGEGNTSDLELRINTIAVEIPAELAELLARVENDLGRIPEGYVQAAAGIAGRAIARGSAGGRWP